MTVIYREEDGNLNVLVGKRIAVIGYGNLGRPIALNLRDSGVDVVVGLRSSSDTATIQQDNIPYTSMEDAAQQSDIIMLLVPDEVMADVYIEKVSPHLRRGKMLMLTSGYNIAFGFIEPPPFIDVALIAPRTIGAAVREHYVSGAGFYSFVAAGQDASGAIWDTILAVAKAIGSLRAGAVEVTIEQETELDLFMQQAILPAIHHIMTSAATLLLSRGYPPEAAMMDLYISGEFNDYLARAAERGLLHALRLSPLTAQFGIFSRLERFKDLKMERLMEATLEEIRNGDFGREWAREFADGYPRLRRLLRDQQRMDLWDLEQQTIDMLNDEY